MVIKNDKEGKIVMERIKKDLLKDVALAKKYGMDVGKFWADLQKTLKTKD